MNNFLEVTELGGDDVSQEQVERVCTRYAWALQRCGQKDVLEVACGTGPGLGLLQRRAKTLVAGDISDAMVAKAKEHYGSRIDIRTIDAVSLPFHDRSLDVVIIFEALYYVAEAAKFISECARVLRPGGVLLISNANKDLYDFNPSPHSHVYHGVVELDSLLSSHGFVPKFWGDVPVTALTWKQRLLRPVKKLAVMLGLMPRSMAGKKLLKWIVFGRMRPFPREISEEMIPAELGIRPLPRGVPDRVHKVILCEASLAAY